MNPIKTAFAIIEDKNGRIALVKENGGQGDGLWCLPGGHVEIGETSEQTAIRETKEEAGIDITLTKKLLTLTISGREYRGDGSEEKETIELMIFRAAPKRMTTTASWFTRKEIETMDLRWEFLKEFLRSL